MRILQIIPANEWKAVWAGGEYVEKEPQYYTSELVCFALIERPYETPFGNHDIMQVVEGFTAHPESGIGPVNQDGNFLGYAPLDATDNELDDLFNEAWHDWKEKESDRVAKLKQGGDLPEFYGN